MTSFSRSKSLSESCRFFLSLSSIILFSRTLYLLSYSSDEMSYIPDKIPDPRTLWTWSVQLFVKEPFFFYKMRGFDFGVDPIDKESSSSHEPNVCSLSYLGAIFSFISYIGLSSLANLNFFYSSLSPLSLLKYSFWLSSSLAKKFLMNSYSAFIVYPFTHVRLSWYFLIGAIDEFSIFLMLASITLDAPLFRY